jgi:RNA polymerase sigma-70 factor (ECF subfamily)
MADTRPVAGLEPAGAAGVRRFVATLPLTDRKLLFMQYWQDVPVAEIASRLDMPLGTVKVRLHRARAQLRRLLEEVEG